MIRPCGENDFEIVYDIVNDAAQAYRGAIPSDCWHDPYMSREALRREFDAGVFFWGFEVSGRLVGIMGMQDVRDVTLIRHAYVRTLHRGRGIGGELLSFVCRQTEKPTLVGTWRAASWAVRFYEKHGFILVSEREKNQLLKTYWAISPRQIETSVVLADPRWIIQFGRKEAPFAKQKR